ncbi:MAG TPA: lipid II flippase MurJ, partial [Trueperaceae bacterium]|nr:lipid II flippase MurJ [Trueperaceae bacterium]
MSARQSTRRGAMTLMVGTLASRVTGLLKNSLLAQFFPTAVIDAFVTAFKVPNLFRELLAEGALTNSFIPVYKRLDPEDARRMAGAGNWNRLQHAR